MTYERKNLNGLKILYFFDLKKTEVKIPVLSELPIRKFVCFVKVASKLLVKFRNSGIVILATGMKFVSLNL